jgi:hypothetical protein
MSQPDRKSLLLLVTMLLLLHPFLSASVFQPERKPPLLLL